MRARPAPQVFSRVPDIRVGEIEPEHRQPRPALLDAIEEAAGAAGDIDQPQPALVAPGKGFRQRRQRLPPHRVRRSLEQHLDLGVVAVGGVVGQPAARLEMEILQVVVGAAAARLGIEDFVSGVALAARVDVRQVAKNSRDRSSSVSSEPS